MKAKGLRLSSAASEVAHPEAIQALTADPSKVLKVPQWQIARNIKKPSLFNKDYLKRFSLTSSKRWFIPDSPTMDTFPYGYVPEPIDDLLQEMELALAD